MKPPKLTVRVRLNRFLILLFIISSTVLTTLTIYSFFAWPNIATSIDYDYYYFIVYYYIVSNSLFLLISIYILIYILKPFKELRYHLFITLSITIIVSFTIYYTFYRFFDVIEYFTFFMINSTKLSARSTFCIDLRMINRRIR